MGDKPWSAYLQKQQARQEEGEPDHAKAYREPPQERGKRLLTLPRKPDGSEELRVNLAEYNGRPYLSLTVWSRNAHGDFWPTKKSVSIRIRELPEVITALIGVAEGAEGGRA